MPAHLPKDYHLAKGNIATSASVILKGQVCAKIGWQSISSMWISRGCIQGVILQMSGCLVMPLSNGRLSGDELMGGFGL